MKEGYKTKGNEIVVILGRSQSFGLDLTKQHKLPFSYLNFDFSVERLINNLKPHLRETDNLKIGGENPVYEIHVPDTDTLKIYFINLFTYANICKTGTLTCILQTLIKDKKYNPDYDQLLYFCHGSDFGKSGFTEGPIDDKEKGGIIQSINALPISKKISLDNFFIATFYHEPSSRIFSALKEKIEKQQSESLNIKEIYKSFDKEKLADTKNKIINTFLPLILDIKGFEEVTDPKQREEYGKEILHAIGKEKSKVNADNGESAFTEENDDIITGYGSGLKTGWNEIKAILNLKIENNIKDDEVLSEKYQLKNKNELFFPIENNKSSDGFTLDEIKKLFEVDQKDERKKVVEWFDGILKAINKKIEPQRESGISV